MKITASGKALGAIIEGIDLAQQLSESEFKQILRALGAHGVLCFPKQRLATEHFVRFGRMFGELEINVANQFHEPGFPEVMVLSNMTADGKPIGLADAGQGWHTDMSYSKEIALANVLYAMRARPGSPRAPLTPQQRAKKPPVSQPIFRTHPITGRAVLYCNPGYATHIDGMGDAESAELLQALFAHQAQEKYFYAHQWTEGDVLMWDNIGTVHNAVADYRTDEPRYMRRLQIMATKDYARLAA